MGDTKAWWQSTTMWGAILAMGSGAIATYSSIQIDPLTGDFHGNVYTVLNTLGGATGVVGGVVAAIGRMRATKQIVAKKVP